MRRGQLGEARRVGPHVRLGAQQPGGDAPRVLDPQHGGDLLLADLAGTVPGLVVGGPARGVDDALDPAQTGVVLVQPAVVGDQRLELGVQVVPLGLLGLVAVVRRS